MAQLRFLSLAAIVAVLLFANADASHAADESCASRFPEAEWQLISDGPVSVEASGISPGLRDRFGEEIGLLTDWITKDIGNFETTVCLVSDESAFDAERFAIGTRRLHAHSDLPGHLVVLDIQRIGFIAPASAYALAQHALWQNNGDAAFPEPIASVIGQWYRARILERLEQYHADRVFANLFDTEAIVDWTASVQEPVQDWDPENNFQSIGDFIDFAVGAYGTDVLLETDGATWSKVEGEWRVGLRNDLRGRDTDTTGWIGGVALTVTSILVALVAIALGLWSKYRRTERAETPPPIPGFFTEPEVGSRKSEVGSESRSSAATNSET